MGLRKLFGTDGIRGSATSDLTPELVSAVGRALAAAASEGALGGKGSVERPRVVIGRDTRPSGSSIAEIFTEALRAGGADVLRAQVLPTAAVAFLTGVHSADAGVVISASHNPPGDNGIKIFGPGGWKLPVAAEERIEALATERLEPRRGRGEVCDLPDALETYVEHLISCVDGSLDGLRVVVDCADGAGSLAAPLALRRAGAEVVALNADGDGGRINEGSGALHPEVVADAAKRHGAIGLALDGDADRVLMADETGRVVDGDAVIALVAAHMRELGELTGDGIAVTVMSNQALLRWCASEGISVVQTPVGDRYILEAMREHGLVLGGEQAGHIARLDRSTTGDGILVGLTVLDMLRGRRLADLVPFSPLPQVLVNIATPHRDRLATAAGVSAAVDDAERRLGEDGRVLVRASGTEPLVRVMVEAPDERIAGEVAESVADVVRRELNGD